MGSESIRASQPELQGTRSLRVWDAKSALSVGWRLQRWRKPHPRRPLRLGPGGGVGEWGGVGPQRSYRPAGLDAAACGIAPCSVLRVLWRCVVPWRFVGHAPSGS